MPRLFLVFPLLGLLGACQAPPFSPDSPLTAVPVQSTLILHEPLTLPSRTVSLWFQNGKQQPEANLDRYYPHCKFETLRMQDAPKTVEPDSFMIHKVVRWDDYAMQPVRLAASRLISGLMAGDSDGGPSHVNTTTEMFLRSARQPDVYRLICSQWEDAAEANHVTINQMRRVLGETFTLKLPEERSINPDSD
ncbi:MAG: hypothetical protein RI563_01895 [Thiohalophilus sp.]|uniref:hypothetical protein n=1 Tax=Thiohalophilus sp. TaxID=3028392 RepID=UPI0028706CAC|nr:hypothetical protein [Thiohalophilus sp.]MDR9435601.1 hypothetical protein [Thiohalophilus sp.]